MDDLGTGWEHLRAGRLSDAEACYRRFCAGHPNHAEGWTVLGIVSFQQGNIDEAIRYFLRSLTLQPGSGAVLTNLGVAYAVKGDFPAAEQSLRQAIAVQPKSTEAHRNLGHALRDQGKFAEAAYSYQHARKLGPHDIDVLASLGNALEKANRAAEAIEPLVEATKLAPQSLDLHQLLGVALAKAKRFDAAEAAFRNALALDPTDANTYCDLAVVQTEARRFAEAEASCREAIRLNPHLAEAYQNLGNVFRDRDEYDQALACYASAIELRPDSVDTHYHVGFALGRLCRHEDSIAAYDRVLALDPDHPEARKNRALMKLLLGDCLEGFAEFECRVECREFVRPNITQPVWRGESIASKTILLIADQGLGDTIQFIRFAPKVKALGATVLFRCPRPLLKLFANFPGIDVLIPEEEPLPSFDVYVSLMSLAARFRTSLDDVPGVHPVPYLRADATLVERWSDRLGPRAPGALRAGIFWQGNPDQTDDRFRSAPLAAFLPLAAVPGVKLISFQKGHGIEQIPTQAGRLPLLDFGDAIDRHSDPFQESAALMSLLDVMVTICSAPVHLAGALGVPTWLALARYADWRWLADREDSPWYPTVRIFRQRELFNWSGVFERMARALADHRPPG